MVHALLLSRDDTENLKRDPYSLLRGLGRGHPFKAARSLRLDTDLPLDTIAVQSGFHLTTNLRRAFKDLTGSSHTPGATPTAHRDCYCDILHLFC